MASTIKVDKIEGSTGSTVTVPTGQTLTITDGLAASTITSGTISDARLPTTTVAKGGTNTTSYTAGDIIYASGATTLTKLAKGTTLQHLRMNAGATAPEWTAAPSAGGLLQCISATKVDTWSSSGSGFQAITGLTVTITPASASNKILIQSITNMAIGDYGGGVSLYKGGSQLVSPTSPSSRSIANANGYNSKQAMSVQQNVIDYLDSPSSTSALTYAIYAYVRSGTYYVNRSADDTDTDDYARTISTITAFEVGV